MQIPEEFCGPDRAEDLIEFYEIMTAKIFAVPRFLKIKFVTIFVI